MRKTAIMQLKKYLWTACTEDGMINAIETTVRKFSKFYAYVANSGHFQSQILILNNDSCIALYTFQNRYVVKQTCIIITFTGIIP